MHMHTLTLLKHDHSFAVINKKGELRTKIVLILTFLTMALEITAGILFGSMALLADGWHMGTHVAAFMIAIIISLVSHTPKAPEYYKGLLKNFHNLSHITVEVNQCHGDGCSRQE